MNILEYFELQTKILALQLYLLSFDINGEQVEKEVFVASSDSLNAMNKDEV